MRLNEGFVGLPIENMEIILDEWFHTFSYKLPRLPSKAHILQLMSDMTSAHAVRHQAAPYMFDAKSGTYLYTTAFLNSCVNASCKPAQYLNKHISLFRYPNVQFLRDILETFTSHIPAMNAYKLRRVRDTRSGWDSVLFFLGIASRSDLTVIHTNVETMHEGFNHTIQYISTIADNFHSFSNMTMANFRKIESLFRRQGALMRDTADSLNKTTTLLLQTVFSVADYNHAHIMLSYLRSDLELLCQGNLPFHMISHDQLYDVIEYVKTNLSARHVPLFVTRDVFQQIYSLRKFVVTRAIDNLDEHILYITLQLPLALTRKPFTLYRTFILHMAVENSNHTHSSLILNLPPYFAWSWDSDWYLEFSEYPHFESGLYYLHTNPQSIKHRSKPTCIVALLTLERDDILNLCSFAIQPFKAEPAVIVLSPGRLILQFISEYSLTCNEQPAIVFAGCALCVLRLPCHCVFNALQHTYYSKIAHCDNSSLPITPVSFAVNLVYLHKLFNTSLLLPDHTRLLDELPNVLLPNISFHLQTMYEQLGLLKHSLVDMDLVIQNSLANQQTFLSTSDEVLSNFLPLDLSGPNVLQAIETVLIFLNPIISILAVVGFIYLFFQFRTLTAAFALLGPRAVNTQVVKATTIWIPEAFKRSTRIMEEADYSLEVATVNPEPFVLKPLLKVNIPDDSFRHYSVIALISIAAILLLFCICFGFKGCLPLCKWFHRTKFSSLIPSVQVPSSFTVLLAIGTRKRHCVFPLMKIPFTPSQYRFVATAFAQRISVTGLFRGKLHLDWPNLTIVHKVAPLNFLLPDSLAINWNQARVARHILRKSYYVLLYLEDRHGNLDLMPLEGAGWDKFQPAPTALPEQAATHGTIPPPLYPSLALPDL